MAGRPSSYSEGLAERICHRLSEGESLLAICKGDDMPAESTVRGWVLDDREGFSAKYARSRDMGLDHHNDHILEIADTATDAALARVKIDARKWYLSKLAPKKYGERIEHEHSGEVNLTMAERLTAGMQRARGEA